MKKSKEINKEDVKDLLKQERRTIRKLGILQRKLRSKIPENQKQKSLNLWIIWDR